MATAPPCRLSSPRRTARAVLTTLALALVASATLSGVLVLVHRALADGLGGEGLRALAIAVPLAALWLLLAVVVLGELWKADRPARRSSPPIAWLRRLVAGPLEASLLGTGTLAGWTSTRIDGSLADLEQPVPDSRPVFRPPAAPDGRPVFPPPPAAPPPISSAAVAEAPSSRPRLPLVRPRPPAPPAADPAQPARSHLVRHGETWWSLAELYLGDGGRASVLKQVNAGRPQPDGSIVDLRRPLRAGWTIEVPVVEGEKP